MGFQGLREGVHTFYTVAFWSGSRRVRLGQHREAVLAFRKSRLPTYPHVCDVEWDTRRNVWRHVYQTTGYARQVKRKPTLKQRGLVRNKNIDSRHLQAQKRRNKGR